MCCKKVFAESLHVQFEIWGFHDDDGCGLQGSDTVWSCRWLPTFWRNVLPPFTLKTEVIHASKMSVTIYKTTNLKERGCSGELSIYVGELLFFCIYFRKETEMQGLEYLKTDHL
jgi:hypothetical protein